MAKQGLLKIPGFSQGVHVNQAVRMITLARPICPNSKLKMVRDSVSGQWIPSDSQPMNCQLAGRGWWKDCGERGHDPYFTNRIWYSTEDLVDVDEEGNEVVTGTKRIKHVNRYPNLAQVSASIRHNSGRGALYAVEDKGFMRLEEIGYEEVCQFRNCQKPVAPNCSSQTYGRYCSKEHLSLIAADVEGVLLRYTNQELQGVDTPKVQKARERQLREVMANVETY